MLFNLKIITVYVIYTRQFYHDSVAFCILLSKEIWFVSLPITSLVTLLFFDRMFTLMGYRNFFRSDLRL